MDSSILKLLPGTKKNVPLAPYTTFKIGGKARYFFVAKTTKSIVQAVNAAQAAHIPFFILGGGSNLVISDKGFSGLVIHIRAQRYRMENSKLFCEAGVPMAVLVKETGRLGLSGLEWAGGLPGSVGGAIRGNAGAFGGETKDNILWVIAMNEKGQERLFSKKQCRFSYRSSVFKERKLVILSAAFALCKGDRRAMQSAAQDHIAYRKTRHPLEYPNAGSVFKNCDLKKFSRALQKQLQPVVKTDPFPVVPTAYLNDKAGLKGTRVHDVQVSLKHPNFLVNLGKGRAKDVVMLIAKVKKTIKKKFGVELEQEVEFVS